MAGLPAIFFGPDETACWSQIFPLGSTKKLFVKWRTNTAHALHFRPSRNEYLRVLRLLQKRFLKLGVNTGIEPATPGCNGFVRGGQEYAGA